MKKHIYITVFFVFFLTIFSSFFGGEYFDFHKEKINIHIENQILINEINNFTLQDINTLKNTQITFTPNKVLLESIISKIDNAKEKIYVEIYILTEKDIQEALINAYKRGLDVQVLMEQKPYMTPHVNKKTYESFSQIGLPVVWGDNNDYALNHSKFMIIDNMAIISTGNLSNSTFTKNRDIFITTTDTSILNSLNEIFKLDYSGDKKSIHNNNLILSPSYSRYKFNKLIDSATVSIDMYFQYFKDEALIDSLIGKANQGVKVQAIISKNALVDNQDELNKLQKSGVKIRVLEKNTMHAKSILIDHKYLYIGSINFSHFSLDENRELGILFKSLHIIQQFLKQYNSEITTDYFQ